MKFRLLLPIILTALGLQAQEISRLELEKGTEKSNPRTNLDIYIPLDLERLNMNDPIDNDLSEIVTLQDDTGKDLIASHLELMKEYIEQGRVSKQVLRFYGIGDYANNKDVKVTINLQSFPDTKATSIQIKGMVVFNFISESEVLADTFKIVKSDKPDGGVKTNIGSIMIESKSTVTFDGEEYYKFKVVGIDNPILSAEVIGSGSGVSLKLENKGLEEDEFAIKNVPEDMKVRITYAATEKVEIPIDLNFSVGL